MTRKIIYILIALLSIISIYLGFTSTIIPNLIMYILIAFYFINLIILYLLYAKKRKKSKKRLIFTILGIILIIILIITSTVLIFVNIRANRFFNKVTNAKYETNSYSLIVLKDSTYKSINDLSLLGLYHNDLDKNYAEAQKKLTDKINISEKEYTNPLLLITDLNNKTIDGIFINDVYIDIIDETNEGFIDSINIIDTVNIDNEITTEDTDIDITKVKSFNLYISGLDKPSGSKNVSRSDVNIIATVNLETGKILLTNTPRDYYIQLHGTTGLKDKLSHAGVLGVEMSLKTLEDLYDIKIDYYIRVNFNSLIKVVDTIGGIDVYSDRSLVGAENTYFKKGWNHMNGEKALAYARTRKAYETGDRHRGQNQQQVIEAIIQKVTKSNNITYYLNLFKTIENSFQTNLDKTDINNLINLQVKNKYEWKFEMQSVDGDGIKAYFYTYPNFYDYAMEPSPETVEAAKKKINDFVNEKK